MKFCFGTFARVLNLHRANNSVTQPQLVEALLCLPLKNYTTHKDEVRIDQQMASRQLSCVDSVPPIYIEEAKNAIDGMDKGNNVVTVQNVAANFKARIFDKALIRTDKKSLSIVISVLLDIIDKDDMGDIEIDRVGGKTKNALLSQSEFALPEIPSLLAGLFLYAVTATENRDGVSFAKAINKNYIKTVENRVNVVDVSSPTACSAQDIKNKKQPISDKCEESKTLFISYCHHDQVIAGIVEDALRVKLGAAVKITKFSEVPYRQSFKEFMRSIKEHDFVLSIVSDYYLKSKSCMYEIGEIIHTAEFKQKMLFILISENERKYYPNTKGDIAANVYTLDGRNGYIEFWENECNKAEGKLSRKISDAAKQNVLKYLSEARKILDNDLFPFLDFLADANGLSFEKMCADQFEIIAEQIQPTINVEKGRIGETPLFGTLSEPHLPFIFVVDTSASMSGQRIAVVNDALATWIDNLSQVGTAPIDLAVVSFNTITSLVQDFVSINANTIKLPRLQAEGVTSLGAAILQSLNILDEHIRALNNRGVGLYKPIMFIISDGEPTDSIKTAMVRLKTMQAKLDVYVITLDNTACNWVNSISAIKTVNFTNATELFETITASICSSVATHDVTLNHKFSNIISFFDGYGVSNAKDLDILERWTKNADRESFPVPVGVSENDLLVEIDIHEAAQGPNGIVAGSSGSGKSEFLITYILGLAINNSPQRIELVLIDYRGGREFSILQGLPHVSKLITDMSQTTLNWLEEKIETRKRQLDEVGAFNVDDYNGFTENKIPHLVIVVDEFAELKVRHPKIYNNLLRYSNIGRTLGVHLILGTQTPDSVVNDATFNNSQFFVLFRASEFHTANTLGFPKELVDFYQFNVGRACLRANKDHFSKFQTLWSGQYVRGGVTTKRQCELIIDEIRRIGELTNNYDSSLSISKVINDNPPYFDHPRVKLKKGDIVDSRYEIIELIGQGGVSSIYKARHIKMNRIVALKEYDSQIKEIDNEINILTQLKHQYLPQIFDVFTAFSSNWISMEFFEGKDLMCRIRSDGAINGIDLLRYAHQLCEVVNYLHTLNPPVIHGDIKPNNILISEHNNIVLIDFNLSGISDTLKLIKPVGITHGFTAPELYEDRLTERFTRAYYDATSMAMPFSKPAKESKWSGGHLSIRSDIYSIGATLFYLATGIRPPYLLSDILPSVSLDKNLREIIGRCTDKNPNKRYISACEIIDDLSKVSSSGFIIHKQAEFIKRRFSVADERLMMTIFTDPDENESSI